MASSAVETSDRNIIVALFDYDGPGSLAMLSEDGTLIDETLINDNGYRSGIEHLFQDPDQPDLFYGIGEIADPINQTFLPYIIHFDDKLNILSRKEVKLPDEYKTIRISRTVLTKSGKFMYAGALDEENATDVENLLLDLVKEEGRSLLLVTHNQEFAFKCDNVYLLKNRTLNLEKSLS